jgi:2,3,4,5-tetrahydropyridine-2,6-dicarboxylate N-succinyltransferase
MRTKMSQQQLQKEIMALAGISGDDLRKEKNVRNIIRQFIAALNSGAIRSAERDTTGKWRTNTWVKEGILVCMRFGVLTEMSGESETLKFADKDTLPLRMTDFVTDNIRIVPGGSSIRDGSFIGKDVVMMPPAYVNIGAYVGEGTMLDSHALVGSCAQVGQRCHISAGAQIGGVLEPVNASPCIVEDEVLMGINTSIAEGVILRNKVLLAPGVNITSATPVYDLVKQKIYKASSETPLEIPEGAVVVNGTRPKDDNEFAVKQRVQIQVPVIIKYRDESTDLKSLLEEALR